MSSPDGGASVVTASSGEEEELCIGDLVSPSESESWPSEGAGEFGSVADVVAGGEAGGGLETVDEGRW